MNTKIKTIVLVESAKTYFIKTKPMRKNIIINLVIFILVFGVSYYVVKRVGLFEYAVWYRDGICFSLTKAYPLSECKGDITWDDGKYHVQITTK